MQELQRIYREALPGRIAALGTARTTGGAAAIETIRRIAHALRGSGGTYGFPEVSEAAQAVEEAAADELGTRLDHLVALLRATAHAPAQDAQVLLVEDEPEAALLIRTALERKSMTVTVAGSATEARAAVARGNVSLILLDVMLPDADGRALLLELRNRVDTADTPIIVISAKSDAPPKAECFDLGANGYFEKPLDPELLAALVNAQLRSPPPVTQPSAPSAGAPVLVVEDDDLVISVLRHQLEHEGHCVIHCADGLSTLELLQHQAISLAILDVKVPRVDGLDLLARLRAREETAETPVIMLTAVGGERDILRALQLGADDYVTKPFSPIEILARVRRLLAP